MIAKPVLYLITFMALLAVACGFSINLPVDRITTGPTQTENINIAVPDAEVVNLTLGFGAGRLRISPGSDVLVSGTITYNVPELKPVIETNGADVKIETGNLEIQGIPDLDLRGKVKNDWNLSLGSAPMNLVINAGAYEGIFELGNLSLRALEVNDGAGDTTLEFSKPNLIEMDTFRYTTGASDVKLNGLGFANFASMIFRAGAGNYTLDFTGALQRDTSVTIEAGMSNLTILVPEGTNARVSFKGGLTNISASGDWSKSANRYTMEGSGPTLTITVDMGAGNLDLQTIK